MSRASLLLEMADQWIGVTEGLQMARHELSILLSQYHRLMSQIAGTQQMLTVPGVGCYAA